MISYKETPRFLLKKLPVQWFLLPRCRGALLVIFFFGFSSSTNAQSSVEYSVHANIIYHFTKYVAWPESKKSGDFVIGIVGDSPLYDALKLKVANKTAVGQKIVVKQISRSQQVIDCHILFISEEESDALKKIASRTAEYPVLLVCEDEGAASRGAAINFKVESERLKLEINKNNIEQRSLSVASELLRLGTVIK
jgi:hypothetical protein